MERKAIPCKHCRSLEYIFDLNEDMYIRQMEAFDQKYLITPDWLYIQTDFSFWKIGFSRYKDKFVLFHGNKSPITDQVKEHEHMEYHRQTDLRFANSITQCLDYIHDHDQFRKNQENNIKQFVYGKRHKHKLQRKLKNKRRRKALAITYETIDMLAKEKIVKERAS